MVNNQKKCMYCNEIINEEAKFCTCCGKEIPIKDSFLQQQASIIQNNSSLIGFSRKIDDPLYNKYKKNSSSWSIIFALILAVIAVIAFPVYGNISGELEMPVSLYYGMGIGGMFIIIAFLQTLKRNLDNTWDGTIIDKKTYERISYDNNNDSHHHYIQYVLIIRRNSGKIHKHRWNDIPGLFNYYNIGDCVRHHKGFYYYEKYDKSKDTQILCAACLSMNDINSEYCNRCKCPLLK
ncbi:MAG: hypothetical protein K0S55_61 [Clostridia bacterium]|nr:hypothetical protein [Clostridia bacterium]